MMAISKQVRNRILAIGILVALVSSGLLIFIGPVLLAWADQDAALAQSVKLLSAYQSAGKAKPALEARLRQLQQQTQSSEGLVEGSSSALAGAKIQGDLRNIVEANGGMFRSTQNLQAVPVDKFEKIPVAADFSLPMDRLTGLLTQLENHEPSLFIEKIEIRMPENWQPESNKEALPKLEVRWVIDGYRWNGGN